MATSNARVQTDRAGRYGKQLVSHLGRRSPGTWDDESGSGRLALGDASVVLQAEPDVLVLTIEAGPDRLDRLEEVVGSHLVRFGTRDELVVSWQRSSGGPGQPPSSDG